MFLHDIPFFCFVFARIRCFYSIATRIPPVVGCLGGWAVGLLGGSVFGWLDG